MELCLQEPATSPSTKPDSKQILCGDGFMGFIQRPKSKLLKY
jgi:hypothetical protein